MRKCPNVSEMTVRNYWNNQSDRETPLWLSITGLPDWNFSSEAKEKLAKLELETPSRLIEDEYGIYIPINLPTGVEKDEVISSILTQMRKIIEYLNK